MYANGDVYEGLWRAGKCEGPGRYRWRNKNEYDGEWRAGRMHGKGTLKWNTGAHRSPLRPQNLYHAHAWQGACSNETLLRIDRLPWASGTLNRAHVRQGHAQVKYRCPSLVSP